MDTKLKLVWHKYFFPWNYPSNWIRNIKQFFRAIKNFIERGRYGVSTSDCWNLDGYLCNIFRNGIIKYKKDNCSYPAFITAEEWDNVLDRIIELIEIISVDPINCKEATEIFDFYYERKDWEIHKDEWLLAMDKYAERRLDAFNELGDILKIYFDHLWW